MHEPTLPRDLQDAVRAVGVDDAERAALADLLGNLAMEPVPPDELTARRHIRAMCEAGPATVASRVTTRRRRVGRVRVVAASWIAAATVLGGAGVAAATGSLPGPIQHAVAGVTHAVGVDIPGAPQHHPNPHGPRGATGGSSDHRGTRSGSGDPATHEGTPGASVPARGSGAPGVTTASSTVTTAPPATTPTTSTAPPGNGNGASASSPGHGATPPGQGGTPPGQVTNPGNGNNGNGNNGNANGQGNGNGASASSPGHGATPPGQGGTAPGQQKKASGA
jgi:hypothetical protein